MALAITSFTPTTGPAAGGTEVTITGTQLDLTDVVLVGNVEAHIVSKVAGTLVFRTPANSLGAKAVTVVDVGGDVSDTGGNFTYTADVDAEQLVTTLANKFRLDVSADPATAWDLATDAKKVRGITTIKVGRDFTTEDDSDIDTGIDSSDLVTGRKSSVTGTVKRGRGISSGNYDPGQEIIRLAAEQAGEAGGTIKGRVYDRLGGPEAYEFFAIATWSPQGGNKTADKVDFTLSIQGARTIITNPVIADNSLSDGLFTP